MSRNDVLLVVKRRPHRGWYVIGPVDADAEWSEEWVGDEVARCAGKGTTLARAFVTAFRLQRQWETEYGVRTMYV